MSDAVTSARPAVDPEAVNDRAKLLLHRLVARAIRRRPEIVDEARAVVAAWLAEEPSAWYVDEWERLLGADTDVVARALTLRTDVMSELRSSSPFSHVESLVIADPDVRRRIWRLARRGLEKRASARSPISIGPLAPSLGISAPTRSW